MAKTASFLKYIEYLPILIGAVKQIRSKPISTLDEDLKDTKKSLDDAKKQLLQRLEDVENENARLKTRIREVESALTIQRVLVYMSGGVALLAIILSLIALIRLG